MREFLTTFCFSIALAVVFAQPVENRIYRNDVATPLLYPLGNPTGYPMIALGSGEILEARFDVFSDSWETVNFTAIHCTRSWEPSDLESTEYIEGFPWQEIPEVEASFSTLVDFYHYAFTFPNDMMRPRFSGNYALVAFTGTDPMDRSSWIVSWRMVIYENLVAVGGHVRASSVVSRRFRDQEVVASVRSEGYQIIDPNRDLSITILQNGSWQHAIPQLRPRFIRQNEYLFDYSNGETSMSAVAEWRDFENKNLQYTSLEVYSIYRTEAGWDINLRPDPPMGTQAYSSRIDINGSLLIRNDMAGDSNLEAEYCWVTFVLPTPEIMGATVFVESRLSEFGQENWVMKYDDERSAYVLRKLMKQGFYNYRYAILDEYHPGPDYSYTEGEHSGAENDYHILVYHYDRNLGCDRIIGIAAENSVR